MKFISISKRIISILVICSLTLLVSCKKDISVNNASNEAPFINKMENDYNLDFTVMHNFVIDSISQQYTPFFYVKNGEFDISGDNDKKIIKINCTCLDGTTINDLDLFLSLVLNYIGFNAAEQDYRFEAPKVDNTGTYINFGTVFDVYGLSINAKTENGEIIRSDYINAKQNIPIESKYWSD